MSDFRTELGRRILLCDGAIGTMLHAAGNSLDRALPELNLTNPQLVTTVHESYVSTGVDIIQTNTFGASRIRLAELGTAGSVRDINLAGVRIARAAAAAADRPVFVAGSVSPATTAGRRQNTRPDERVAALREQVSALVEGGVDLLVLETFGYLDELLEAVTVATTATDLPVIAQATFTADGATLGGQTPGEVAAALADHPVAAIGTNCTLGPQGLLAVVTELRRGAGVPVTALPNAGLPRRVSGRRFEYTTDGGYFARYARRYAEAGASVIGGCCGTTPTHIAAAADALAELRRPGPTRTRPAPEHSAGGTGELAAQLSRGGFVVAVELAPHPGGLGDEAAQAVTRLRDRGVHQFLVTGAGSARAQLSATDLALHLQQRLGVRTLATVTTWDKTIMTLQADLLGAHALGVRAVVCETGNPPLRGDYPNVDGIWDVDSVGLIALLNGLNEGRDCNGLTLATKTSFHIGARFNPGAVDLDAEVARTRAKLRAGAQLLITRPLHEPDSLRRITAALAGAAVPVLACVAPLRSFAQAEFLAHEVPGTAIPAATLRALQLAPEHQARDVGLRLAVDLLGEVRTMAQGALLRVPQNDADAVEQLLAAAG